MSYEGREEHLCEVGHRWAVSCYASWPKCPFCGAASIWDNAIDDTNGNAVGTIPDEVWEGLLLSPERRETCNLGHAHVVEQALYRTPTPDEVKNMRHYWNGSKFVPLQFISATRRT